MEFYHIAKLIIILIVIGGAIYAAWLKRKWSWIL